ncbi:helix-turn-helix protein [Streptomyces sp. 1114.5]|uniref:ArsR/SmtB family transcription factor n=1 Tax=unclassified Streptomyces TaxID=2593676 RepID=UPI000BC8965F|nr:MULTISPECIES: helix-turn-helix domain-containing protein [unclassified Streptomyces]RKT19541.1 helix-turn-helix protein [Streptomyces sp. 1114.5]SOB85738.1 Helix-turn-helix domain-containing protein [Streptomyces sp. 1331.2]
MIALRFGVADLAKTRFVISPLDHLMAGSARVGVHQSVGSRSERWWRDARRHVPHQARRFLDVVNASPIGVPDFMVADLDAVRRQLTDELDALLAVPQRAVEEDVAMFGSEPELPTALARLRDDGTRGLREVSDGAWALFRTCLAPDWPDIRRALEADIAERARTVARAGIGAMLDSIHPKAVWREEGVLECTLGELEGSFELGGRGLELRPNYFVQQGISLLAGPDRQSLLLHPLAAPAAEPPARPPVADGLAAVLGPARARVLRTIAGGPCSTTELARQLGVTPPSASAHAAALRAAGLIVTRRQGKQVRHTLTDVGHDLLLDNPEPSLTVA